MKLDFPGLHGQANRSGSFGGEKAHAPKGIQKLYPLGLAHLRTFGGYHLFVGWKLAFHEFAGEGSVLRAEDQMIFGPGKKDCLFPFGDLLQFLNCLPRNENPFFLELCSLHFLSGKTQAMPVGGHHSHGVALNNQKGASEVIARVLHGDGETCLAYQSTHNRGG